MRKHKLTRWERQQRHLLANLPQELKYLWHGLPDNQARLKILKLAFHPCRGFKKDARTIMESVLPPPAKGQKMKTLANLALLLGDLATARKTTLETRAARKTTVPYEPAKVKYLAMRQRRRNNTIDIIKDIIHRNYRAPSGKWVGGKVSIDVAFSDCPGISTESVTVWHRKHTWSGTNLNIYVKVKETWLDDVYFRDIGEVKGLMLRNLILDATRLDDCLGCEIWKVVAAIQGKCLSIDAVHELYVAKRGSFTCLHVHSQSAAQAVNRQIAATIGVAS